MHDQSPTGTCSAQGPRAASTSCRLWGGRRELEAKAQGQLFISVFFPVAVCSNCSRSLLFAVAVRHRSHSLSAALFTLRRFSRSHSHCSHFFT